MERGLSRIFKDELVPEDFVSHHYCLPSTPNLAIRPEQDRNILQFYRLNPRLECFFFEDLALA
ncbi:hypothetical protein RJ40_01830 [Methanofollis aquaemaris]|uniref:Uncharacterized protein n=1 Tax=Methanofollis aquaemaris TaxID=126734 RepID=A0A8A3S1K9_9EURY|nr:hypothetical protein [Methanofollis aquaemaris]QSZ66327.1 hypothetical protein RJ40_01830 [Methanofollis aquaemaris]